MAIIADTYLTYTSIGQREDLTDFITNISPYKTPVLNRLRRTTATGVTHDFQTDVLEAAEANAVVEGNDAVFTAISPTTRLTNTCQIMAEYFLVSGTADAVSLAGRKNETAYQLVKKGRKLATDMEYGILQNTAVVAGNSTTARTFKGMAGWITTNTIAAAAADVTQLNIDESLSDIWTAGNEGNFMLVCGAWNKREIAGFTTGVTKNLDADDKRLVYSVDVYEAPIGGMVEVVSDHFITASTIFILDPDLWAVAYLRPVKTKELAPSGDARKHMMLVEFTLESKQEAGNASITGTSTS